ncbi:MAG: phenylalanine--tRNA ligase subunit beta [Candidatus Omnitrophica bacterium]|nr:phenylalanine--tRNA ligase subunit beta [Candidatus Omnitrophota bacterium]
MKVTYSWLKDFVDLKIAPVQLAEKLTMAGLEVVSLEEAGKDYIFEIEITSNRPDWLSVLGIAREVGAICGLKLKTVNLKETKIKVKDRLPVKISVSDKKDCPFYSARVICDVKVGPSPDWLKQRLESLGCRSVNNIVDITNYILFETGQPLHAFDLDTLNQKEINVRRGRADEKIITIDGQQKILDPEILVIADKDKPVAIAGIMGGKESEVTFKTRNILLESAVFNPILVRRGKQKLGLQSESAYRFERGVDLETAKTASLAAQELILKLASGKPCAYKSAGALKPSNRVINLDLVYVNKILGLAIPAVKIKQILSRLGLGVKAKTKNILAVKIPGFRQDIKLPIDLVEELARIYGYAKIPQSVPAIRPSRNISDKSDFTGLIKNILSGLGLREVITYSLVDRALLSKSGINTDRNLLEILNPLSKEQEVLRPALLPSLIRCLAHNLDQQQENIKIFEIADVFSAEAGSVREEPCLAIALCGINSFLTKQGLVKEELTLLHLKGMLEALFNRLGARSFNFIRQEERKINIILGNQEAGFMLDLSRQALDTFDIKNRQVILAQLSLEKLSGHINLGKKFSNIPKFPAITRDISFVIKNEVSVSELLSAIEAKGAPLLRQARVTDYYQGKQIPQGFKGLTVSCIYRLDERTLTEEEVNPLHDQVCSLLKERFEITLR